MALARTDGRFAGAGAFGAGACAADSRAARVLPAGAATVEPNARLEGALVRDSHAAGDAPRRKAGGAGHSTAPGVPRVVGTREIGFEGSAGGARGAACGDNFGARSQFCEVGRPAPLLVRPLRP